MSDHSYQRPLLQIKLQNFLSFGPEAAPLELENLNILIGPNAAGKSNLIEALALMRATPVSPAASNMDLRGVVRRGGGAKEWVWKGGKSAVPDVLVSNPNGQEPARHLLAPKGHQPLRHVLSFRGDEPGFRLEDERIENQAPDRFESQPTYWYRFQHGQPSLIAHGDPRRAPAREALNPELSILAQLRDPERHPEIARLTEVYEKIRIYREWTFGRNTVFREPQRADMRSDRLEEDFSNLGLFLSRLRKTPKAKAAILNGLKDLYEGVTDFEPVVEGGAVQVFFSEGDFSVPATRLSDGTLRYLCLLAILCDPEPPPLICIEEPELGLHPDILPKLADLLRQASERTQLIVTTHSDLLVDAMTEHPEAVVVCEKHEGKTEMRRLKKDDLTAWLDKYRLGQLWIKGQIGGTRW
ncbi:MAG: AAA family ATPase [Bryobacteraceae bacterium]